MDGSRFDDLTRGLARGTTRRRVLAALVGGVAAAAGLVRDAAAACRGPGRRCAQNADCCLGVCDPTSRVCVCPVGTVPCRDTCCFELVPRLTNESFAPLTLATVWFDLPPTEQDGPDQPELTIGGGTAVNVSHVLVGGSPISVANPLPNQGAIACAPLIRLPVGTTFDQFVVNWVGAGFSWGAFAEPAVVPGSVFQFDVPGDGVVYVSFPTPENAPC